MSGSVIVGLFVLVYVLGLPLVIRGLRSHERQHGRVGLDPHYERQWFRPLVVYGWPLMPLFILFGGLLTLLLKVCRVDISSVRTYDNQKSKPK